MPGSQRPAGRCRWRNRGRRPTASERPVARGTRAAPDPVSDSAAEPADEPAEEAVLTPEQEAAAASERDVKALIVAYQATLEKVDNMPALVWISWARTGPGKYVKIPYLRWFLRFFVAHHVNRNLNALGRRLHSNAALAADSDANRSSREMIKLYQQSLPSPPYRNLIFAVIAAALVIALPLQAIGNVFYVLDLVGAVLRVDVSYLGRAFASKEVVPTVRSLLVLLIGLIVVAGLLTSPFGLKRALLNLYPWTDEDFGQTAARSHGLPRRRDLRPGGEGVRPRRRQAAARGPLGSRLPDRAACLPGLRGAAADPGDRRPRVRPADLHRHRYRWRRAGL